MRSWSRINGKALSSEQSNYSTKLSVILMQHGKRLRKSGCEVSIGLSAARLSSLARQAYGFTGPLMHVMVQSSIFNLTIDFLPTEHQAWPM